MADRFLESTSSNCTDLPCVPTMRSSEDNFHELSLDTAKGIIQPSQRETSFCAATEHQASRVTSIVTWGTSFRIIPNSAVGRKKLSLCL